MNNEHPHPSCYSPQVRVYDTACCLHFCVHVVDVEPLLFLLFVACFSRSQSGMSESCAVECPLMFAPVSLSLFFSSLACCFFLFFVLPHISCRSHTSSLLRSTCFSFLLLSLVVCVFLRACVSSFASYFSCHPRPLSSFLLCLSCSYFLFLCCLHLLHLCAIAILCDYNPSLCSCFSDLCCCVRSYLPLSLFFSFPLCLLFVRYACSFIFYTMPVFVRCACRILVPLSLLLSPQLSLLICVLCGVSVMRACVVCAALLPSHPCPRECEMRG